jgi:hypothetical protein
MGDQVKGRADFYREGDWNAACSMCGRKRKASEMVQNWQGLWRCPEHNEPRQPQDFVRGVQDIQTVPWAQRETDINVQVCSYNGASDIVGWAQAGCVVIGRNNIIPVTGLFGFTTTGNLAGQVSGTITQQTEFFQGTYKCTFSDGEVRNVTFSGLGVSWTPALNNTPGLYIDSFYTIIGTS